MYFICTIMMFYLIVLLVYQITAPVIGLFKYIISAVLFCIIFIIMSWAWYGCVDDVPIRPTLALFQLTVYGATRPKYPCNSLHGSDMGRKLAMYIIIICPEEL